MTLHDYLTENYIDRPDGCAKVHDIFVGYRAALSPRERKRCLPKWGIALVLSAKYTVGTNANGVAIVAGLSPRHPRRWVRQSDGSLTLATG